MEARYIRPLVGMATTVFFILFATTASAQRIRQQREHVAHSQNFIVFASSPQWAEQVAQVAEQHRRELSIYWLGEELPAWSERCPLHVQSGEELGAGGETTFSLMQGAAGSWRMSVQGTPERILDSVLPHEITHTIFATHFAPLGKYVPRWADEGACTTVEHEAEKSKHRYYLHQFLKTNRGLSFNTMFSLKEYPPDILPLYAQGHSAVQFLLDQGGPRKFIQFIEAGMKSEAWEAQLREYYTYRTLGEFQTLWNKWLADGSPADLTAYAPGLRGDGDATADADSEVALAAATATPVNDVLLAGAVSGSNQVEELGSAGWYKRRLREVSGSPATPVPEHNTMAKSSLRTVPASSRAGTPQVNAHPQATARPLPVQTPGIQVLDWGDGAPVGKTQHAANPNAATPWLR